MEKNNMYISIKVIAQQVIMTKELKVYGTSREDGFIILNTRVSENDLIQFRYDGATLTIETEKGTFYVTEEAVVRA